MHFFVEYVFNASCMLNLILRNGFTIGEVKTPSPPTHQELNFESIFVQISI